jgi:DNA-binding beta-propeller fold protein YncE
VLRIGNYPFLIAVTPDGRTAYVSGDSGLTPIRTATGTAGPPITIGDDAISFIAVTPDGKTAYVVNDSGADPPSSGVVPIRTATNTAGPTIPVTNPAAVADSHEDNTFFNCAPHLGDGHRRDP